MRRPPLALPLILLTLTIAACAAPAAPGWTYAPPTEAPPSEAAPSGAAPSGDASAAPSSPAETPGSSEAAGGTTIDLVASGIQFQQTELSAPADTKFTVHFDNQDAGTPHDFAIKGADGQFLFKGDLTTGPQTVDYSVPPLPAGTYQFVCTVHPNMVGTITVGG